MCDIKIVKVVEDMRDMFLSGRSRNVAFRLDQLKNLLRMYQENWEKIGDALRKDLKKPIYEAKVFEYAAVIADVKIAIKNLRKWTQAQKLPTSLLSVSDNAWYRYEPFGTVLIISPWNYPFALTFMPLCAAIASGNCAVIKPSELSPHSSAVMAELVPKYLDWSCFKVITGGPEVAQELLEEKWDFIFYTGSTTIGKIVYNAAAKNLTPVCLELGGKSPVYIDQSADIKKAAQRIMWGKCSNLGQTCIAPDYLLCTKELEKTFIQECRQVLQDFYGANPQENKDLGRIVNKKHFSRIRKYLSETKGTVALGGSHDEKDLWIEPTIVVGVDPNDLLMSEEIFGPVLPIYRVRNSDEAIAFINQRPKPLAIYAFSTDKEVKNKFTNFTNSGGVVINDCIYQFALQDLPFGGVGDSGIGQYHGLFGFQTFSRPRSVLDRSYSLLENWTSYKLRHPPYLDFNVNVNSWVMERFDWFTVDPRPYIPYLLTFVLGLLLMYTILNVDYF